MASARTIDGVIEVARALGADRGPVRLADLRAEYHQRHGADPSFEALLGDHTVNVKARFPDPENPRKRASWMVEPHFYRVSRGLYQLLTPGEIEAFLKAVAAGHPHVFLPDYDFVGQEVRSGGRPASKPSA